MKILFASSEVVPFSKTGGLADVSGVLPIELAELGHEVIVIQPAYPSAFDSGLPIRETETEIHVLVGSKQVTGKLLKSHLPRNNVTTYLIDQPDYYRRDGLYQSGGEDYNDNCERFVFFCRAALESVIQLDWYPDLVHCNDWQTGLIPVYLKTLYRNCANFRQAASLLTIHNLAYQGNFWHWDMLLTGLDWQFFNWNQMEFYGRLNLLKSGLVFADALSTVSPRYAQEIQTAKQGFGLQGVLAERRHQLTGILNGIDTQVWNPATDPEIAENYSVEDWKIGKRACKAQLQSQLGLPLSDVPMVGIVGRLASQKGWSLILPVMEWWVQYQNIQWVVLGTGEQRFEHALRYLSDRYPDKLSARMEFSNPLAHQIEAGVDIFLMPSEFEPCGLNQQYSMRYGTVPVVHETGGLADTVVNTTPETVKNRTARGFSFDTYLIEQLETCLARAVKTYLEEPDVWSQLVETGMQHDWSWSASARQYAALYEHICESFEKSHQPA